MILYVGLLLTLVGGEGGFAWEITKLILKIRIYFLSFFPWCFGNQIVKIKFGYNFYEGQLTPEVLFRLRELSL